MHNGDFSVSVISSTYTNWNSALRQSDPFLPFIYLINHLYRYGLGCIYFILWVITHCWDDSFFAWLDPGLAIGSSFKLTPMSLDMPSSSFEPFFIFWHDGVFQVTLYLPSPRAGISHSLVGTWLLFLQRGNQSQDVGAGHKVRASGLQPCVAFRVFIEFGVFMFLC